MSKHNQILFIIQNYISRPILGHPQVHNWSSKHADEEIYIMWVEIRLKLLELLKRLKVIDRNNMCG